MKVLLISIVLLVSALTTVYSLAAVVQRRQDNQVPATCDEARAEVARFGDALSEWGSGKGGDAWRSSKFTSAEGETFWEGFNFYKSESRFKKAVRQINEDMEGVIGRKPIFDDNGREVGQRIVKETRVDGKTSSVLIQLITPRSIHGIRAPSLGLALTVEKARITCQVEAGRNTN